MIVFAHRGLREAAFENTFDSIREAFRYCEGVEFDVQLTACGTPVLFHDATLERTHGLKIPLYKIRYDELRGMPMQFFLSKEGQTNESVLSTEGYKGPIFIPKLVDILREMPQDFPTNIEIKTPKLFKYSPASAVVEVLKEFKNKEIIISSFNPLELLRVAIRSRTRLALLTDPQTHPFLAMAKARYLLNNVGLYSLNPHHTQVNFEYMREARRLGLRVFPWTVNHPHDIRCLNTLDVDGLITDHPFRTRSIVERLNRS